MEVHDAVGMAGHRKRLLVAHVAPYDPAGANGVSRAALNWARVLPDFDIDVEIWDFSFTVNSVIDERSELCRIFRLPCYRSPLLGMLSLPRDTRRFLEKRIKCVSAIHLHSVFRPENHWVARLGLPFVVSPHNGYNADLLKARSRWKKLVAASLWERADLNRAHRILALNARECRDLGAYGAKVPTLPLPNVLDPSLLAQSSTATPPGDAWVFLGRLDVQVKGLDNLLAGFAQFRKSRAYRGNRLVIAGPDVRGGSALLRRMAARLGIADSVDFPGPKYDREKVELFESAALFLHPSRSEGLPYAVLEALAYGRPVMITQSTNLAEVVLEYGAGWVVAPTPSSIAETFERVAAMTPAEMQTVANSARELIRQEFASNMAASQLASIYREIAS
jgi:glycosyltransferase involved in cell wall biosynthesis